VAEDTKTPEPTTMLYRAGDTVNPEAWNLKLDTLIVADADIDAAKADGWLLAADALKPAKKPAAQDKA
jgi:hypothetical protein